ncbi:hypothetical protein M5K25_024650 [Dendrobium thyrsiflorum]|uniref:Uncharacterized protein n=1 Tax=Dendrobium thyrsiflorum TaxID=117978 RepID=A0ABD0U2P3_DENTH
MSPDQGLEALLEGSNRNSDYQTVSKFDNLIVESSGSTRRVQRAQERRNPTSLSQKIVHQTIHDQGIQYRPPLLPPCSSSTTAGVPPDHRLKALHSAGPPPKRPYSSPDHHLKALHSAGPPPKGPIVRRTTSRRPYTSPDHRRATSQRPYALPKARRAAQGQTLCSRPDVLLKALRLA